MFQTRGYEYMGSRSLLENYSGQKALLESCAHHHNKHCAMQLIVLALWTCELPAAWIHP